MTNWNKRSLKVEEKAADGEAEEDVEAEKRRGQKRRLGMDVKRGQACENTEVWVTEALMWGTEGAEERRDRA